MKALFVCLLFAAISTTSSARAADAGRGRALALSHCAVCHIVVPGQRNEVADAPPFDVIGRKQGFDVQMLRAAILAPHPKMNFSPSEPDAADIAAYIGTLAR
jgi:mono/diheme cytochrome c family protein